MDRQPRIVDLLPRSYGLLAGVFLAGVVLIAGLEAGYYYLPRLTQFSVSGRIAALELAGEGNLAMWFSTTLLSFAAATALVIHSLRKHRADDYHGRYRIWFLAACSWFYLGIDEAASVHETIRDVAIGLSGNHGFGDGSIWWIGAYAAVFGLIGIQLVLDMRECRTSTTFFVASGLAYAAAAGVVLNGAMHWVPLPAGVEAVMIEKGLQMVAHLLLLTAMLAHARYVLLEAEGEIKPRAKKAKKEKSARPGRTMKTAVDKFDDEDEPPAKRSLFGWLKRAKVDPPHSTPAPTRKLNDLQSTGKSSNQVPSSAFRSAHDDEARQAAKVKKVRADFSELDDDEEDEDGTRDNRKLSKADRKALRRQKEMERRGYGG